MTPAYALILSACLVAAEPEGATKPTAAADAAGQNAAPQSELPAGVVAQLGTTRFRSVGQMMGMRLSPNGRILAVNGTLRQLRMWDVETGKLLRILKSGGRSGLEIYLERFPEFAWTSDGKYFAHTDGESIRICDGQSLTELVELKDQELTDIRAVRFAPGNRTLIAGGQKSVIGFDVESGKLLYKTTVGDIFGRMKHPFAENPNDGFSKLPRKTATMSRSWVTIDLGDGKPTKMIDTQEPNNQSIAASADVRRVYVGDRSGKVTLWDGVNQRQLFPWPALTSMVDYLSCSADGSIVAAGSLAATSQSQAGNRARIYKVDSRTPTNADMSEVTVEEHLPDDSHNGLITALDFIDGGRHLVSASGDGELGVWNVAERKRVARLPRGAASQVSTTKGLIAAYGTNDFSKQVRLYDLAKPADAQLLHTFEGVSRAAVSDDGRRVAALKSAPRGEASAILVWDVASRKLLREIPFDAEFGAYSLLLNADGTQVALGSTKHKVRTWDVDTGALWVDTTDVSPHDLIFTPNGRKLVTKGEHVAEGVASIHLWDIATGTMESQFGNGTSVMSLAVCPDGRRLLAGGKDGVIRVWDLQTRELLKELPGQSTGIYSLAVSPDGKQFASGNMEGAILLWDGAVLPKIAP